MYAQQVKNEAFSQMLIELLAHNVTEVTVVEILENKKVNYVFLDAREQKEYEISHLKDAIWVGYDDFSKKRIKHISKDTTILVYCSIGARSENIGERLKKMGYKVFDKEQETFFKYSPIKKLKKFSNKKVSSENPFKILKNLNLG